MSQVVLVTGSSSGFGRLTVETLARQGHTVFASMRGVADKHAEAAQALRDSAARNGWSLQVIAIDVSDDASVRAGVQRVIDEAGRMDVLVNNVGQGSWGVTEGFSEAQLENLFEVNVFGAARMNRAVLPQMREQGSGLLVHMSTLAGRLVIPFMASYAAAKHALEALAEGYHFELSRFGVESVIVEPQSYPTDGSLNKMVRPEDEARVAAYGDFAQQGEQMFLYNDQQLQGDDAGNPQDVADAVAKLIHLPAGERPLRTVVGGPLTQLVAPVNQTYDGVREQLYNFMGFGQEATS